MRSKKTVLITHAQGMVLVVWLRRTVEEVEACRVKFRGK